MIIDPQNISATKTYSRIVSLVPSQTELLHDLGLDKEVLAITKFCVHPEAWFKNKPRIGGTKNVKIDLVKNLFPDLIIANKEENVKEQIEQLSTFADVLVTDVNNLADALAMIKTIGILTGKFDAALTIANAIEIKFKHLILKSFIKRKIQTAYLIWKNPYMAVGGNTFINNMMSYCGLENFFSNSVRYPKILPEDLKKLNKKKEFCELIVLSSEPYPFKEKHVEELRQQFPLAKIILADGEMFSWYGSRLLLAPNYFEILQKSIDILVNKS